MRCSLPAVTAALVPAASAPEINLESGVRISPVDLLKIGEIRVNAAGVAAWYATPGVVIPAGGLDLHLRNDTSLENLSANPTVTLTTTFVGPVTATSIATFSVPSYVADQSKNWPLGQGVDFVGVGGGNTLLLVTAVSGISATANLPANSIWSIWGSTVETSWVQQGFKRNVDGPYKTPTFVEIPDKYDNAAAVKKGRSESGSLELAMVHLSSMGGLTRYNGRLVSVMVDIIKNGVVQTERIIYSGYGINAKAPRGDGNDEVVESSTGPYQSFMNFVAP